MIFFNYISIPTLSVVKVEIKQVKEDKRRKVKKSLKFFYWGNFETDMNLNEGFTFRKINTG